MSTSDRGFASMDKDKQREIASKGGGTSDSSSKSSTSSSRSTRTSRGAAGKTAAARRGGEHSHRTSDS